MESITLKSFVEDRITENKELFTIEELQFISKNRRCVNKIYLLGAINTRDCYQKTKS